MSTTLITILVAILVVGLFTLAMSITLIIKGHNIESEIGTNKNMKRLGISCTASQDGGGQSCSSASDGCVPSSDCSSLSNCSACPEEAEQKNI